jgi:hypothetical protein
MAPQKLPGNEIGPLSQIEARRILSEAVEQRNAAR